MQTASITSLTPVGGLFIALTIVMSFCFNVSRAVIAAFIAGMATASFSSHSSYKVKGKTLKELVLSITSISFHS